MRLSAHNKALNDGARAEAAGLIRKVAEPCAAGEHIEALIARAADRLKISFTRARKIWHQEARRIDSWEMDLLRNLAANATEPAPKPRRRRPTPVVRPAMDGR